MSEKEVDKELVESEQGSCSQSSFPNVRDLAEAGSSGEQMQGVGATEASNESEDTDQTTISSNIKEEFSTKFERDVEIIKESIPQLQNEIENTREALRIIAIKDEPNDNWAHEALALRSEMYERILCLNYIQQKLVDRFNTILKTQVCRFLGFVESLSSQLFPSTLNIVFRNLKEFFLVFESLVELKITIRQDEDYFNRLNNEIGDIQLKRDCPRRDTEVTPENVQYLATPADNNIAKVLSQLRQITEVKLVPMLREVQPEVCLRERDYGPSDRCTNAPDAIREYTATLSTLLAFSYEVQDFNLEKLTNQFQTWKNDILTCYWDIQLRRIESKQTPESPMTKRLKSSDEKMFHVCEEALKLHEEVTQLVQKSIYWCEFLNISC
ncbi:hypothetical protein NPIL_108661 [Nephila pilipes]|uniref:Uncharacterized protein n=1 Tax=Nephila pilipes TaxID=299642 RepID=A0A8X6N5A8_NEPPI|nr:hypothetical protein NPIL_108661 [Nephila pilipes]